MLKEEKNDLTGQSKKRKQIKNVRDTKTRVNG